jgi:hypothetical protein
MKPLKRDCNDTYIGLHYNVVSLGIFTLIKQYLILTFSKSEVHLNCVSKFDSYINETKYLSITKTTLKLHI